jgi:signal transduction histidine kinase
MSALGVASVGHPDAPSPERSGRARPYAWALRRLRAPSSFDGTFTPLQRRLGVLWAIVALPFIAAEGLLANTPHSYAFVFAFCASGAFTVPSLAVTFVGRRIGPRADIRTYSLWLFGVVLLVSVGLGLIAHVAFGWTFANGLGAPVVTAIAVLMNVGVVSLVRIRSGGRALSVDLVESVMSVVAVVAPCALLWGDRIIGSEHSWWTVPSAIAFVAVAFAAYWAVVLVVRLGPDAGVLGACGLLLAFTGLVNAAAQTAQGLSGFTLPAVPLLALHAVCMSMMLLAPLHLPSRPMRGLDRLPPEAQVRGGGLAGALTLLALPALLVVTAAVDDRQAWAQPFALGVMGLLLVLAAVRHLLAVRETRRLYGHLEAASEERRRLLAQVMQRADGDRHRVAAELHEQAVSAYASFVSFIQAVGAPGGPGTPERSTGAGLGARGGGGSVSGLAGMSTAVRDDLARHADSLRHLMLAIRPIAPVENDEQSLAAPIRAYVDNLYGDRMAPRLRVTVAGGLVLDWVTETIALRIVQEALRNVWRHSDATNVDVTVGTAPSGTVEVRVVDDGIGFDPTDTIFESGIGAMRSFAEVVGGRVQVDSARGVGTSVVATLGRSDADEPAGLAATSGRPGRPATSNGTARLPAGPAGAVPSRPRLRVVRD